MHDMGMSYSLCLCPLIRRDSDADRMRRLNILSRRQHLKQAVGRSWQSEQASCRNNWQ